MKPHIVVIEDWPQPDTVSMATVAMFGSVLVVGYGTREDEYVLVSFAFATDHKVGGPNDEVLHGHPLYDFGLKHYSIHRVEHSPWLEQLNVQNSVHHRHDRQRFMQDKVHYLFALKEETVECIVRERHGEQPQIELFPSLQAAMLSLKTRMENLTFEA
jgi:hypothetical protein